MKFFYLIYIILFHLIFSTSMNASELDSWFASRTDNEMIEAITAIIEDRFEIDDLNFENEFIAREFQVVFLVWSMTGSIENGGMTNFWSFNIDHAFTITVFHEVGLNGMAQVLKNSLEVFPEKTPVGDLSQTIRFFGDLGSLEKAAEPHSMKFFSYSEQVESLLAKYIRDRRHLFADLL